MAQLLANQPAIKAAWLNYAAAQAERDAEIEMRISDLSRNLASLRGSLDAVVDTAVRRALEGTELRVMGLGALVDALNAQGVILAALDKRMGVVETRGDVRTAMLQGIAERLDRALPAVGG